VEQARQPRTTIVVSRPIQIFPLPNLRYHALLPKIFIHRLIIKPLFRHLKYPSPLSQLQRRPQGKPNAVRYLGPISNRTGRLNYACIDDG
jgi:hypothetical protein